MRSKIIILFFALALFGAGCRESTPQAQVPSPTIGKADAPVQIVEYFDFQCPTCKSVEETIIPFIIEDYVDTGKAAITFKNMAFIGKESKLAAIAGLCAAEQGKFLEYKKEVFSAQNGENKGIFTEKKLKDLAVSAGLDSSPFEICFTGKKYADQVKNETDGAFKAGINGTPTFVVNGQAVQSMNYLSVKRVIDKKLEELKK
ncbi:MAG: thioredoxin domain-containing protein [Patescibacteria group bacterium]